MKRLNWIWIIVVCLGLSFSVVFAQNKMWVTSGRAKLKTDKKASSKTIATLPMGTEVTVLASEKNGTGFAQHQEKRDGCTGGGFPNHHLNKKRKTKLITFFPPCRGAVSRRMRPIRLAVYAGYPARRKNMPKTAGHRQITKRHWIRFWP